MVDQVKERRGRVRSVDARLAVLLRDQRIEQCRSRDWSGSAATRSGLCGKPARRALSETADMLIERTTHGATIAATRCQDSP